MFNLKNALLWAVPAVCLAFSTVAGENKHSLVPYTYHSTNLELKPSPFSKGYKLAAATFLPEFKDSEFGWTVTRPDGPNVDFCKDYPLTSCPDNAECSDCPTNKSYHKLLRCKNGFQNQGNSCIASTCQASGYEASVPTNQICTKITQGGLTCYKDCRSISCAGYTLDCDNFNVSNSNSKETCPDCSSSGSNCSPKLCKVSSCQNGYKIADNGTTCVALDDTCPNGYYKECETGTEGDPEYTEKGTACYMCKAKPQAASLPILYSDLTTSTEVIAGKTPIGVVFDESKKLAINLKFITVSSYCLSSTNTEPTSTPTNREGKKETLEIMRRYETYTGSGLCNVIKAIYGYQTEGTLQQDWYLPSINELETIYNKRDAINEKLSLIKGNPLSPWRYPTSTLHQEFYYWSLNFNTGEKFSNTCLTGRARLVINYAQLQEKTLPILYSDLTVSTQILPNKTPIGVVYDEEKKLAVATSDKDTKNYATYSNQLPWHQYGENIPTLTKFPDVASAIKDTDGIANSKKIREYLRSHSKMSYASGTGVVFATINGIAEGWSLPSIGDLNLIYEKMGSINSTLSQINGAVLLQSGRYWSSTQSSIKHGDDYETAFTKNFDCGAIEAFRKNSPNEGEVARTIPIINYGDLKKNLPILYSDLTTSTEVISGKKPIGVVFDEEKKLAVGLNEMTSVSWTKSAVDIPDLPNFTTVDSAKTDWNGRNNTSAINSYCSANSKSCPAAEYGRDYYGRYGLYPSNGVTVSTNGYWYIPSGAEWNAIYQNKDQINAVIEKLGSSATKLNGWYWTSTEANASAAWAMPIASGTLHHSSPYKGDSLSVRTVISYGEIGQCNYPYSTSNCRYKLSGNFCGSPAKYESCTTVQNCGQYSLGNCVGCISGYTLKSGICEKNQKVCTQCITYGNSCSSAITSKYGAGFCIVHPTITQKPSSCKTVVTVITDPCEGAYCYVCKN